MHVSVFHYEHTVYSLTTITSQMWDVICNTHGAQMMCSPVGSTRLSFFRMFPLFASSELVPCRPLLGPSNPARMCTLVKLRLLPSVRPSLCLYVSIDSTHLHSGNIRLSTLPLAAFIFTKGWENYGGGIIFKKGVKGRQF